MFRLAILGHWMYKIEVQVLCGLNNRLLQYWSTMFQRTENNSESRRSIGPTEENHENMLAEMASWHRFE
jgi:hypothetical protein